MNYTLSGSSVHGDSPGKNTGVATMPSSRDLPDPEIEPVCPVTPALQADSLLLSQWGSPNSPDNQDLILYNVPILPFFSGLLI